MKIICEHCKNEFEHCSNCQTPTLERDVTTNTIILIIVMLACVISGFRWYNALDDYERAMKLRDAYLKEKLQNRPALPFTK
jgi:hypothetical protein